MAKRLSEEQKEEIIKSFTLGKTIEELSLQFNCTKLTISRNLKRELGEAEFKDLINKCKINKESNNKNFYDSKDTEICFSKKGSNQDISFQNNLNGKFKEEQNFSESPFVEILPLDQEIDNLKQKDLSSVPISSIDFPKIVYMIVDKNIELETKHLKDYPEWQFLPQNDLNRKTIEIYFDLKNAKRFCNKEQKVIKVPNTNVFRIVAPILLSRGISRIVSSDKLIAL